MGQLIVYTESPDKPVRVHEINYNENILVDANKLMENYRDATYYTIWIGGWPEFEQKITADLIECLNTLINGGKADLRELMACVELLRVVTPIRITIKDDRIRGLVTLKNDVLIISEVNIYLDATKCVAINDNTLTITNDCKPWELVADQFAELGYHQATYKIEWAASRLKMTGALDCLLFDFVHQFDVDEGVDDHAQEIKKHHEAVLEAAKGRKIWWIDDINHEWHYGRFVFGEEEEIVDKLNQAADEQVFNPYIITTP